MTKFQLITALTALLSLTTQAAAAFPPSGCVWGGCGQPNCAPGWYKVSTAYSGGGQTCADNQPGVICCSLPPSRVEWIPPVPTATAFANGIPWPQCQPSNPCGDRMTVSMDFIGDQPDRKCKYGYKWLCAAFSTNNLPNTPPQAKPNVGSWTHRGCYTDSSSARTLANQGSRDQGGMTVERCVNEAQGKGFRYAGVEYTGECYYGNTIASSGGQAGDGCTMPCGGDNSELCGGGNRMNLYENTSWQPPASANPGVGDFKYRGCRTDTANPRALPNSQQDWNGMTVAKCVGIAKAGGFKYAAVEYYGECYYGNDLDKSSQASDDKECNTPCAGNKGEFCGGGGHISLYENTSFQPPPSPTQNPGVGGFELKGCYTDDTNNRALPSSTTDWNGMTAAKCIQLAGSHKYAAMEYYGECYWGDELKSSAASSGDCNLQCTGNKAEICGGSGRITLYQNKNFVPPPPPDTGLTRDQLVELIKKLQGSFNDLAQAVQDWKESLDESAKRFRFVKRGKDPVVMMNNLRRRFTTCKHDFEESYPLLDEADRKNLWRGDEQARVKNIRGETDKLFELIPGWTATDVAAAAKGAGAVTLIGGLFGALIKVIVDHSGGGGGGGPDPTHGGGGGGTVTVDPGHGGGTTTPPPTSTPHDGTPTTTSKSSTVTCVPSMAPTEVVVMMKSGTPKIAFEATKSSVKKVKRSIEAENIGFYAFVGAVDECESLYLSLNPAVAAMTNNIEFSFDSSEISDAPTRRARRRSVQSVDVAQNTSASVDQQLKKRDPRKGANLVQQTNSPWHLRWLSEFSQQQNVRGSYRGFSDFVYDDTDGSRRPNIYVMDGGYTPGHMDFSGRVITSIVATFAEDNSNDPTDTVGHGTSMLSCAGGRYAGVAKRANLIPIKVKTNDPGAADGGRFTLEYMVEAFRRLIIHVNDSGMNGRSVLSMSFGATIVGNTHQPQGPGGVRLRPLNGATDVMDELLTLTYATGVVCLCSAGNSGNLPDTNIYGLLESSTPRVHGGRDTPLIVVGNADNNGQRYGTSQYRENDNKGRLTIYANGFQVLSASFRGNDQFKFETGTSPATAQVAGLAAYLLRDDSLNFQQNGDSQVSKRMKDYLIRMSTDRKGAWPDGIPRAAMPELIPCDPANAQVGPASTRPPNPPAPVMNLQLNTVQITNDQNVVMGAGQLPQCLNRP